MDVLTTLAAGAALTLSAQAAVPQTDIAAIETRIEAVAVLVDLNAYDRLETLFADELVVDYSSLFGGEAETLAASELMARWAGLVPGFDRTRHAISDIEVELHGDWANATAAVTGTHWLDGETWTVSGRYVYRFNRIDGDWRVTEMTLLATDEQGDRALTERAAARAAG